MRQQDWDTILADRIEAARHLPFAWGTHDCVTWAVGTVCRMRGTPEPDWLGTWESEAQGKRVLVDHGIKALAKVGTAWLEQDPLDTVLTARRGDLVFSQRAYGICIGRWTVHPGPAGLVAVPLSAAELAWRI
jgi:hypothetical protein